MEGLSSKIGEIVEETRRIREDLAAQFNYDLEAIFKELKEKERSGKRKLVSFPPKQPILLFITKSTKESES